MATDNYKKFLDIGFEDFKKFARDASLSHYEKIGFPDEYRKGYDQYILQDIDLKLGEIKAGQEVLDIGPGCSNVAKSYIENCRVSNANITLVDSQEMLDLLPSSSNVTKVPGFYPSETVMDELNRKGKFDKIICYSVFHYLFFEANVWSFLDLTLDLLKPNGRFLLADIPNYSMRSRFYESEVGREFYRKFVDPKEERLVQKFDLQKDQIDDGVLIGIVVRARNRGFHAYILPQGKNLPMENRREDLLFVKP